MPDNTKKNHPTKIRFAIDRGGTFTDVYAEHGNNVHMLKLLSEDPQRYADAPPGGHTPNLGNGNRKKNPPRGSIPP